MDHNEIIDLENVIKLPNRPGSLIVSSYCLLDIKDISGLSFSSILKQLNVKLKISANKESLNQNVGETSVLETFQTCELQCVVKFMPDESLWISLNSETTFEKELNMYYLMVPEYLKIFPYLNVTRDIHPFFPKFYGGRLNLNNTEEFIDHNAIIILENLRCSGYENCRRPKLDCLHLIIILEKLASFHSIGIIIRNDTNNKHILENLLKTSKSFFFGAKDKNVDKVNEQRRRNLLNIIKRFNYSEDINNKIMNILIQSDQKSFETKQSNYFTLLHNDLWINNFMFQYKQDGESIEDVKFLDFQNTNYGSITKDLIFLLYTSCDYELWDNFYYYIEFYHKELIKNLKYFYSGEIAEMSGQDGRNIEIDFQIDDFKLEFKTYACHKLKHVFILQNIMYSHDDSLYQTNIKLILDSYIQKEFL